MRAAPHTPRRRSPAGFTLLDVLTTLAVLGIVLFAIAPVMAPNDRTRLIAATNRFVGDLDYARSACVANPNDPTGVRFLNDGTGYFLSVASEPDEPINHPYGSGETPYSVVFGEGNADHLTGLLVALENGPSHNQRVQFDAFGRVSNLGQRRVVFAVAATGESLTVVIDGATGEATVE